MYKQLLKAVDQNLTHVSGNTQWREHVAAAFRRNANLKDPACIQRELQLARDYQLYVSNIADHQVCA